VKLKLVSNYYSNQVLFCWDYVIYESPVCEEDPEYPFVEVELLSED